MANKPADPDVKPPETKLDDTARLSLSQADRKRMNMDSWEPSLLRKLLQAQDRLKARK